MPATLSKELASGPICATVIHPFHPVCTPGPHYFVVGYTEAIKLYGPLFFLTGLLSRRIFSLRFIVQKFLPSVLRSSGVIATFGGLWGYLCCKFTQLSGRPTPFNQFATAFVAAFFAALIEKRDRRSELALYMTNNAVDTVYRLCVAHNVPFFRFYKHGLTLLFAVSMSVLCYFQRRHRHLLGSSEAVFVDGVVGAEAKFDRLEAFLARQVDNTRRTLGLQVVFRRPCSSRLCSHQGECYNYAALGFVKSFLIGYLLKALLGLLPSLLALAAWRSSNGRRRILQKSFGRPAVETGLFLGLLSTGARGIRCLLRAVRGKDDSLNQVVASFLGGLAFTFSTSVEVGMYFASKAADVCYKYLKHKGYVRPLPQGEALLFGISTGIILASSFWEPHNVRPGYITYLSKATGACYIQILAASHELKLQFLSPAANKAAYVSWFENVFKKRYSHKLGPWAAHLL